MGCKMTFLTETIRIVDGQPRKWDGGNIEADSWDKAKVIAMKKNVKILGELVLELHCDMAIGKIINRMRSVGCPELMIQEIIDEARDGRWSVGTDQ